MGEETVERLLWGARTLTGLAPHESFWGGEQRPAPAVFAVVFVAGIDEIFRHDATGHLQTGDIAVETAAHLGACESTGGSQFTGDQRPLLLQSE